MALLFAANANSSKRYQGPSENGRLEIMAEIKLLGLDIKDSQIFCLGSLHTAHLCGDVSQGLWLHTAPLCSQPMTTCFSLSSDCHCVYFLQISLSSERLSPSKTHNNGINAVSLTVIPHKTVLSKLATTRSQSLHMCYHIKWVMCCECLSQSLSNVSSLICIMKKFCTHLHIWRNFLTLRSKMSSVIRVQN